MTVHHRNFETAADLRDDAPTRVRMEQPKPDAHRQAGAAPDAKESDESELEGTQKTQGRRWVRPALFALVPMALAGGVYMYATGGRYMSTDDAYVNARQVGISTDVAGIVADVDVANNKYVRARQVLYRLDPKQFQIAVDNARGNLLNIALSLQSMKADYSQLLAESAAQQSQVELDEANYRRDSALLNFGAIAKAVVDQAQFTLATDQSKLTAFRQQAAAQLVRLGGSPDKSVKALPEYQQAEAQLREAERELDHTVVRAPFSGTVTNVPSIAPGKYLAASTVAFFLVDTDHLWIDATPKETELTHVRPGQKASITVDTYPGQTWRGVVESISPAAAQQFSLLPPQNTSGNWVKVVQRVPLRVAVDPRSDDSAPLRAGMSVEVRIDTGHARGLPFF
ncbi:MAG TPA: HlyD family secretion protein [Rhizomicrobium sp.]|nr:HlyD family secretion protein [Rhizomicrobium sp.]